MSERLRRSRRILAVQSQLDRLARWSLTDLQSQAAALRDQQDGLVRFMSSEADVTRIFSSTMIRSLKTIAEMLATVENERQVQTGHYQEERGRLRRAEKIVATVEAEVRRRDVRIQLIEAMEAALQRRS